MQASGQNSSVIDVGTIRQGIKMITINMPMDLMVRQKVCKNRWAVKAEVLDKKNSKANRNQKPYNKNKECL